MSWVEKNRKINNQGGAIIRDSRVNKNFNQIVFYVDYLFSFFGTDKTLFGEVSTNNCKNYLSLSCSLFLSKKFLSLKYIQDSYEEDSVFHVQKGLHFD